jgi:NTP pyrophosphatase (non-canonical NTP hydrolase)
MDPKTYIEFCKISESMDFAAIANRLSKVGTIRVLHASMGIATEAGELLDALKKHVFYGNDIDVVNLLEEHGDILWYAAILADAVGFSFEDSFEKNIAKLRARYPLQFDELRAAQRDLARERRILEGEE